MADRKKTKKDEKKKPGRPKGSTKKAVSDKSKKSNKDSAPAKSKKQIEIQEMQEQREKSRKLRDDIIGVIYIALGLFIFIAIQFHAAGQFGNILGDFLKGIFGLVGLIFPWYLMLIGVLLIIHKVHHFSARVLIVSSIIVLMLCLINSGRFIDVTSSGAVEGARSVGWYYSQGVRLEGGGFFGMTLGVPIVKAIGKAGLYIFSILITIICLLLMINTPLSEGIVNFRNKREEKRILKEQEKEEQSKEVPQAQAAMPIAEDPDKARAKEKVDKLKEIKIVTPYSDDSGDSPKVEQLSIDPKGLKGSGSGKSNVIDFMTGGDAFDPDGASSGTKGLEEKSHAKPGYGLGDELDSRKEIEKNARAIGEGLGLASAGQALTKESDTTGKGYVKPSINLLDKPQRKRKPSDSENLEEKAMRLEKTLRTFGVDASVTQVTQGPTVTRYEIQPNLGVKVSKIVNLADDIALNMRAKSIRVEAPIPGKAAVGIEIENENTDTVKIRDIIDSKEFKSAESKITFAVGKDIAGNAIVGDLKSMPHLLIAGSTGSGKSVCINGIITSLLYKADPDEVKLILVDPKVVELGNYEGIPHLLIPVVTDPNKAAAALSWAVVEMTNRYKLFADENVRDIASYNKKMRKEKRTEEVMPQIVIIIDELADLMMTAKKQVEECILRLAQLARAAGMHLIVATQRPSVDVITGVIKANIPSRIAFAVSSYHDSQTILDIKGAEQLVGKGDMLFSPLGYNKPVRVQGAFVSDDEINRVISHVKSQVEEVDYADDVMESIDSGISLNMEEEQDDGDSLMNDAIQIVVSQGQASVSMLQRHLRIGYNRAARIVDMMEQRGIVGPADGSRPRDVLITEEEYSQMKEGK